MLSFEKFLTSAHISNALVIALEDLYRRLTKDLYENLYGLFHQFRCKKSHHFLGLINCYCYASALSLFKGTRPCKCFMSVYSDNKQHYRLLLSLTRTLITSVRTVTATALAIVTHIIKLCMKGFYCG